MKNQMSHGFIKVPNNIFSLQLTPKAFRLYLYLVHCKSRLNTVNDRSIQSLAGACGLAVRSATSALSELEDNKLIIRQHCVKKRNFTDKNRYHINLLPTNEGWFKLDRGVFKTDISPIDFLIFCYISKCMGSADREAFPSLTKIVDETGISRSRVSKATAFLKSYSFMNKVHRYKGNTKKFRHNRYLYFRVKKESPTPVKTGDRGISNTTSKAYHAFSRKASLLFKKLWYYFCQAYIRRTDL